MPIFNLKANFYAGSAGAASPVSLGGAFDGPVEAVADGG
jgi:hypothetical protein